MNNWYERLHRSQTELEGADAELVTKMRECYSFLRSLDEAQVVRMLFLTDSSKEERLFWAGLADIGRYQRPWAEESQVRSKTIKDTKGLNRILMEYEDLYAAYADICNRLDRAQPDEELLTLQRDLEQRFARNVMEEYGWEQTEIGKWRRLSDEEFYEQIKAARNKE